MGHTPAGLQRICGNFHSISSLLDLSCSRTRPSREISTEVLDLHRGHPVCVDLAVSSSRKKGGGVGVGERGRRGGGGRGGRSVCIGYVREH